LVSTNTVIEGSHDRIAATAFKSLMLTHLFPDMTTQAGMP
jgi:hypothetical protein